MLYLVFIAGLAIGSVVEWLRHRKEVDSINQTHLDDMKRQFDKVADLKTNHQREKHALELQHRLDVNKINALQQDIDSLRHIVHKYEVAGYKTDDNSLIPQSNDPN